MTRSLSRTLLAPHPSSAAVIRSLTQQGIDGKRLGPHGAGPFAPVASNRTDQGRARNRRVERVEQP